MLARRLALALLLLTLTPALAQDVEKPTAATIKAALAEGLEQLLAGRKQIAAAQKLDDQELRRAERELAGSKLERAVGEFERALGLLDEVELDAEVAQNVRRFAYYNAACARARQGQTGGALDYFKQALEAGYEDFDRVATDEDLDGLRLEPKFVEALERAKLDLKAKQEQLERAKQAEDAGAVLSDEALFPFEFELKGLDGQPVSLAQFKGKVVVIDFWGTWCPPCRQMIPHLVKLQGELAEKGLVVVGLTWEQGRNDAETKGKVEAFAKEFKIGYPLAMIGQETLQKVPDLKGFPTTLFVDRQGRVRGREVGYRDEASLRAVIQVLLAEPAPAEKEKEQPRRLF